MLEHGGRLRAAASAHGIPVGDWLDLSTGINPHGWALTADLRIPAEVWTRLPEDGDGLVAAAQPYYGTAQLLPVAGSQAAIQTLPRLRAPCRVAVMQPGYAEHAHAWQRAGHQVTAWRAENHAPEHLDAIDVLVLMQPNNPTGWRCDSAQLLDWHARLAARGGWLIVDEAFIDATPQHSLAAQASLPGLIVLRSLGKFFGLAGARVGFVMGDAAIRSALAELLGPWPIAGPARWIAAQALADTTWQVAARLQLAAASQRLAALLAAHGLAPAGGCALFQWLRTPEALQIQQQLARRAILVRRFNADAAAESPSLRFGLPAGEENWQRLAAALTMLNR